MYAVIRTGGKQYRVEAGQRLHVERLPGSVGDRVELPEVLMVGGSDATVVGTPTVAKARVVGEIVEQGRARKITVFKYKSKTRYRRVRGHRQLQTQLAITEIAAPDGETITYEVRRPATVAPTEVAPSEPVTATIEPLVDGEAEPAPAAHEAETDTEATAEGGAVADAEAPPAADLGAEEAAEPEPVAVAPSRARKTAAKKATKRRPATKTAAKKAAKKTGARKTSARKRPRKKEES